MDYGLWLSQLDSWIRNNCCEAHIRKTVRIERAQDQEEHASGGASIGEPKISGRAGS